jgi:hypothetical protein
MQEGGHGGGGEDGGNAGVALQSEVATRR